MNKLEKASQLDYILDKNQFDSTITEASDYAKFNKKSKKSLLVAAGIITLVPNITKIVEPKIQKYSKLSIENYVENVGINEYLETLKCAIIKKKYDKKEILNKIISFKMLIENWDGYGAYPLEAESATNAILLMDMIGEELFGRVNDIYPNPNGTITFEWKNNSGEIFSLEIGNEEISYYLEMTPEETIYNNNRKINVTEVNKITEYIRYI